MPDYNLTLTIPANTTKSDPAKEELTLTKGVLAGGQIFFPMGCRGLVHVTINDGNGQLYPANKDDSFHGDGVAFPLVGRYTIDVAPYKLTIKGWSPTTIYEHNPQITLHILSEEELRPYKVLREFVDLFKRLIGVR